MTTADQILHAAATVGAQTIDATPQEVAALLASHWRHTEFVALRAAAYHVARTLDVPVADLATAFGRTRRAIHKTRTRADPLLAAAIAAELPRTDAR